MTSSEQRLLTIQLAVIDTFGDLASETHVVRVIRMLADADVTFETAEEFISEARHAARQIRAQGRAHLSLAHNQNTSDDDTAE